MQKTTKLKKLVLHKTTIRTLAGDELQTVAGGLTRVQPPDPPKTGSNTCNGTAGDKCLCNACF